MTNLTRKTGSYFKAASKGDVAKATRALDAGVEVDTVDEQGCTALLIACERAREPLVTLLLERGADVHATNARGQGCLGLAMQGAPNSPGKEWAARLRLVRLLIEHGADVNHQGGGDPPIFAATHIVQTRRDAFIEVLLPHVEGFDFARSGSGTAVLHRAALIGHLGLVEAALAAGVAVDIVDAKGGTPLLHAAFKGEPQVAKLLLERGADPNRANMDGYTPLHRACASKDHPGLRTRNDPTVGPAEMVQLLVAAGADVNAQDAEGATALEHAQRAGDTEKVEALKAAG